MLEGLHPAFLTLLVAVTHSVIRRQTTTCQGRSSDFPPQFSNLPITINRNSGESRLKELPLPCRVKGRGYSGGTAPELHGIPY